jgi:hypothetical protein
MHRFVGALIALVLAFGVRPLAAETKWPEKPVRLVVGFTPGSATDVTARLFADKFAQAWGQPVVVDNVAGNSGAIGTDKVAKAQPDGYTLMWAGNAAITVLPSLQTLPFDPLKDLAPISTTLAMPSILFVNNDLPVRSIADLIAYAKANPGKLSYGTPGVGTPQHVAGELFCHLAGIKMEHIPYRGANLADVLSGVVPVGIQNAGEPAPGARRPRARHRADIAQALTQCARPADAERSGFCRLRSDLVVRPDGAGRHTTADHRQGEGAGPQGPGRSRDAEEVCGSRPRRRRQHAGGDARGDCQRHSQMGQGHPGRQHQAGQLT